MLGLLVVTHGGLAEELVGAAKTIVGETEALESVSIGWDDDVAEARLRIEKALGRVERGAGVLVLTGILYFTWYRNLPDEDPSTVDGPVTR